MMILARSLSDARVSLYYKPFIEMWALLWYSISETQLKILAA